MAVHIAVIHGPNLNLLGTREPKVYGSDTLDSIHLRLAEVAREFGAQLSAFQSNHEGELIDCLQEHRGQIDGLMINPAAYGHTSIALRDALLCVDVPIVEVHLTNLANREEFRRGTLTADLAIGQISGFGAHGYELAVDALVRHLNG